MNAVAKWMLLVLGLFAMGVAAEEIASPELSRPVIKEIAPGRFQVGTVQVHKEDRSIIFPAWINMTNGLVEYFLVTGVGKLHESVLRTEISPLHIHVAALLLDAKGAGTNLTVAQFNTADIPGEKVSITLRWKTADTNANTAAENLVLNAKTAKTMSAGPWVYNGSQVHGGTLVAERDGQVIAIMSDPLALINNPRPGRENDEIWFANSNSIPPLNTEVECILQFKK